MALLREGRALHDTVGHSFRHMARRAVRRSHLSNPVNKPVRNLEPKSMYKESPVRFIRLTNVKGSFEYIECNSDSCVLFSNQCASKTASRRL